MEQKIYHGNLNPSQIASALVAHFNRGNLRTQQLGNNDQLMVQVATRPGAAGGDTALCVTLQRVPDGVSIQLSNQAWTGTAANIGKAAFEAFINPLSLIGNLGGLAQDFENLQLNEQVWQVINELARSAGVSYELSERLRRLVCPYCGVANPIGEPACIACGAPLGNSQPYTCHHCGFVLKAGEPTCPNCGQPVA